MILLKLIKKIAGMIKVKKVSLNHLDHRVRVKVKVRIKQRKRKKKIMKILI